MKKFIIKSLLFISVLLFSFVFIEIYLQFFPSVFQIKEKYFRKNRHNIIVFVLGSSHNEEGINPEYISLPTSNLAFVGQDLRLDLLLLKEEINKMPKLKFVILELSYHSLEMKNNNMYERNPLYLRFYNINNYQRKPFLKDYSILLSNPKLYFRVLNPFIAKPVINQFGFITKIDNDGTFLIDRFKQIKYDTIKIKNDSNNIYLTRHKYQDMKTYNENCKIFNEMVKLCLEKKITPIVVIPPVYKTFFKQMIPEKKTRRDFYLRSIIKKYPQIKLIDVECSSLFEVKDFMNEDHLNPEGAKKFSKIINSVILNSYK